jgi:hypothetical protein
MGIDLLRELLANSHPRPVVPITYTSDLISRAAAEINHLRKLVLIGEVKCEQCASPATTLDMGEFASCVDCATKDGEPKDG